VKGAHAYGWDRQPRRGLGSRLRSCAWRTEPDSCPAQLGVGVAQSEIDLGFFGKSLLRNLQLWQSFSGFSGVEVEQTEQIVSEWQSRTYFDGLLGVFDSVCGIYTVADGGDLKKGTDMFWTLLQFLLKFGDGFLSFVGVEVNSAKGEMQVGVSGIFSSEQRESLFGCREIFEYGKHLPSANALNHANYAVPTSLVLGNAAFGTINAMQGQEAGGPRALQLTGRVTF